MYDRSAVTAVMGTLHEHVDDDPHTYLEIARRCVNLALSSGLPFPADVDGEQHTRNAKRSLLGALDELDKVTKP